MTSDEELLDTRYTMKDYFAPFFPKDAKNRFIAMFRAFFDDSGTHDGAPVVVVGGVVGKDAQWDLFNNTWQSIIGRKNLSYFHMTDFKAARIPPYSTMSDAERRMFLEQLLLTMKVRTSLIVCSAISASDYDAVLTSAQKQRYGDPFHLAAQLCWMGIKLWADQRGHTDPIPFVIEGGSKGERGLQSVFNKLLDNPKMKTLLRLDSMVMGAKGRFPPLEAADIVANTAYEFYAYQTGGRVPSPWLKQFNEHLKSVPICRILPTQPALKEWVDTIDEKYGSE